MITVVHLPDPDDRGWCGRLKETAPEDEEAPRGRGSNRWLFMSFGG